MEAVYKYPLALTDVQDVKMPEGARILSAQVQDGKICVWAVVNGDAPLVYRRFMIAGTGHQHVFSPWKFLDTVQTGPFVWHVFYQEV